MKTFVLFAAAILAAFSSSAQAGTYELDKSHTTIIFFINHLGFSEYSGRFSDFDGSFTFDQGKPAESKLSVTVRPFSVSSASAKLDGELQGADYFNTAKFPTVTFTSDTIEVTGDDTGKINGTLTLLGVSKPFTLDTKFNKCGYHMMTNLHVCGFRAAGTLKRSEFGMTKLVPYVGDDVLVMVNVEGVDPNNKQIVTPTKQQ